MLLGMLLVVASAALSSASAAPYASVAATSRDVDSPSKILYSLTGEDMEYNDDVIADPAESPPEDLLQRDLRMKNFVRFGRSSNSKTSTAKESSSSRYSRGEHDDNFIRLGRSTSFVRFGRNNGDEPKVPVTRAANSNFIRLGRANTEPNNFIRLGRANTEPNNFIRFGRGENDFIRFGRGGEEVVDGNDIDNATLARLARDSHFIRLGRLPNSNFVRLGRSDNYLRFGKSDNFVRLGRGSPDNFIRFGRGKSQALFGRLKLNDRNFIRLGRSSPQLSGDGALTTETATPSAKYIEFEKTIPGADDMNDHASRFGRDLEHVDEKRKAKSNRRKRSLIPEEEYMRYDDSEEKPINEEDSYQYYSPLAGVPFAPEFTVLPSFYTKRTSGAGNGNYIRFG